jgi:hypothetical protein
MRTIRILFAGASLACAAQVNGAALACAACYGQSDSPMAHGMNAGIFALLGVIGIVLCGAGTFFVVLARRAAVAARSEENPKN